MGMVKAVNECAFALYENGYEYLHGIQNSHRKANP